MPRTAPRRQPGIAALFLLVAAGGCGGGLGAPAATSGGDASEAEWAELAVPRVAPVQGAARVSTGPVQFLSTDTAFSGPLDADVVMAELVAMSLLRRRDVHFVERRRFTVAADRERRGLPREPGAPAAGVSPGAEFIATVAVASLGMDSAWVDVRLTEAATGGVVSRWRGGAAPSTDPVALARRATEGIVAALDSAGRLPPWDDPTRMAARGGGGPSGVPASALAFFVRGLAAEERWQWEPARRGYQRALALHPAFHEAATALARAARLRQGGTLGAH